MSLGRGWDDSLGKKGGEGDYRKGYIPGGIERKEKDIEASLCLTKLNMVCHVNYTRTKCMTTAQDKSSLLPALTFALNH